MDSFPQQWIVDPNVEEKMHEIEWVALEADAEIRQGDLLMKKHPRTREVEDRLVVLTADCDFAQSKTGGALAAVRVLPLEEYVLSYWAKKHAEKLIADSKELFASFNKLLSGCGLAGNFSADAVESWVRRKSPEQICDQLNLQVEKTRSKVLFCLRKISSLCRISDSIELDGCLNEICSFYGLRDTKEPSEAREAVMGKVRSELATLPDDVFLLNTLTADYPSPHIVMLRKLVFLPLESATRSAELAREGHLHLRHARLAPAFKYALSQQFGILYSRIGLPKEYDTGRKKIVANFSC